MRASANAVKSLDRAVEAGEVVRRLRDYGLTQASIAKATGATVRSVRNWQVTSAIRQAGTNQVDIITSAAERQSAAEFARARSVRPKLVGEALREIGQDPEVLDAVFETLEVDRIVKGNADVTLVPNGQYETLVSLLAGGTLGKPASDKPPPISQ